MTKLFISHSSHDDPFVRELCASLADFGEAGWIDSRELCGGDALWPQIQLAIEAASAYFVVVSPESLLSSWVSRELRHALEVKRRRADFPVIPLVLDDTQLGTLQQLFDEEPVYIRVSADAGGIAAAMNAILVALGRRLPADFPDGPQPRAEPLEELILELTDLKFHENGTERRASARARLIYEPANPDQPHVHSLQEWRLIVPIGPIEADDLRWYLEKYAIWPGQHFRQRARKVEKSLIKWGHLLHQAAMPVAHTTNVTNTWAKIDQHARRRFSIYVDTALDAGASEIDIKTAQEAATELLKVPWELLHDGTGYLFQGARPTRVRRRLPSTAALDVPVVATPIRILLVTARPEDEVCGYIDHRASALPLVEASEALPGLVEIHVLSPPTLPALSAELDRAREDNKPYQVIHFDGHGIYDRRTGLAGLCFEHPEDAHKLEGRRHITVYAKDTAEHGTGLESLLRDHRIPLIVLEACQTAQAGNASESIASELLRIGVASIVAMSHSVLVETSRRFVEAFYKALAQGKRVGDAMLAGQRELKDNTFRERIFGAGELRLEDWFVPVLFQEKQDPQLFRATPSPQTLDDFQTALANRLGHLPPVPATGFVGRSRDLLALQRLLRTERYAVIRGQGGEGKTTLAAEFARWMVRSQQMRRAAFVSLETNGNQRALIHALGKQLIGRKFSAAGDLEAAVQQVERVLREQPTLLVFDNVEGVLPPSWVEAPELLSEDVHRELQAILKLCTRLHLIGNTRIVFTSREALPEPFDADRNHRDLRQMDREDAVKLVERTLDAAGMAGTGSGAAREEIEQLVESVQCHARTLALLAPALKRRGVEGTRQSLIELMIEMDKRFPGNREKSLFASVELSLQRMSKKSRERVYVLSAFHGVADLELLRLMMRWEEEDIQSLADDLVNTGLATRHRFSQLTLDPALCPYLRRMDSEQRDEITDWWIEEMHKWVPFLSRKRFDDPELAATVTLFQLPNLVAFLDVELRTGTPHSTMDWATTLYGLLEPLGKPRLLEYVARVRDAAAAKIGDAWTHAKFDAIRTQIRLKIDRGLMPEALDDADRLLQWVQIAGDGAYENADFDLAHACLFFGRLLRLTGHFEQALPRLDEALQRFDEIARETAADEAKGNAATCLLERGQSLVELGRLEAAVAAYEECIRRSGEIQDSYLIVTALTELAGIHLRRKRYQEALGAYDHARKWYTQSQNWPFLAVVWHQIGHVHQEAGDSEAAEDAYRTSLEISVKLDDAARQASTLLALGVLYEGSLNRLEEAADFYRQALSKYIALRDAAVEGLTRSNLAEVLRKLGRTDEARHEVRRAIKCKEPFGSGSSPWVTWDILTCIESDAGNQTAAASARRKAIDSYLGYRREGGEANSWAGAVVSGAYRALAEGGIDAAKEFLQSVPVTADHEGGAAFIRALWGILGGDWDRGFVEDFNVSYEKVVELVVLIERLEA